jgi:hypothetical protein
MVAVGISEFTFGFAFLYEQTNRNWDQLRAVPILPSLQQEAEDAWDARLPLEGTDYYYQFKLSDYLSRSNAKYIADGTYNGPYYRITLHRRENNRQHRRLWQHSQTNPNTYYVAPEFRQIDDFNSAFLARQITERSRLIPLSLCDDINNGDQHYITYREGSPAWQQHSEPKPRTKSFSGKEIENVYRQSARDWRPIDMDFSLGRFRLAEAAVRKLVEFEERRILQQALPLLEFDAERHPRSVVLARTSQILAVVFGVTMVIVGRPAEV